MKWFLLLCAFGVAGLAYWWNGSELRVEMLARQSHKKLVQAVDAAPDAVLHQWLDHENPETRRLAAIRLAGKNDGSGQRVLIAALYPVVVFSSEAGQTEWLVQPGRALYQGRILGKVNGQDVVSPIPGILRKIYEPAGNEVKPGQRLADIASREDAVLAVVEALGKIGKLSDAEELEEFIRSYPRLTEQAMAASQMIRSRRK